ncbi:MAG: hypothetical protein A3G40_11340 [Deltaproteobacteria bacterium RIFCSPLOWO2_12_FULL_57_22]|nr:MAG: hypothetical protein A3G40_11340 [Deltaproteobacteria bacterium RIFCSPLOWO2_12_FULL_57_22]
MSSVFDSHQRATIQAATARIIPTDHDPGALEAGVIDYIERALSGHAKRSAQLYLDGVVELDRLTLEQFGVEAFAALGPAEQDEILRSLEQGASRFFAVLLEHTMEGFYGDPRHGGNKNRVGWKMIGFPGPSFPKGYEPPLGWYDANELDEFGSAKKR